MRWSVLSLMTGEAGTGVSVELISFSSFRACLMFILIVTILNALQHKWYI